MTSKEALEKIQKYFDWFGGRPIYKEQFNKIEKELEVLDILRKYFDDYNNKTKLLNTFEEKEEFEILEWWLEE